MSQGNSHADRQARPHAAATPPIAPRKTSSIARGRTRNRDSQSIRVNAAPTLSLESPAGLPGGFFVFWLGAQPPPPLEFPAGTNPRFSHAAFPFLPALRPACPLPPFWAQPPEASRGLHGALATFRLRPRLREQPPPDSPLFRSRHHPLRSRKQ